MSAPHPGGGRRGDRAGGYALAFGAAASYGTSAVLIRAGLARYGAPLTGVTVALLVGALTLAPLAAGAYRARGPGWRPGRAAILFACASGLTSLLGFGSTTLALALLPVVVAAPITNTYPLVTVLLVRLLLRGSEPLTRRAVLGAALIVAGVILVTLAR